MDDSLLWNPTCRLQQRSNRGLSDLFSEEFLGGCWVAVRHSSKAGKAEVLEMFGSLFIRVCIVLSFSVPLLNVHSRFVHFLFNPALPFLRALYLLGKTIVLMTGLPRKVYIYIYISMPITRRPVPLRLESRDRYESLCYVKEGDSP